MSDIQFIVDRLNEPPFDYGLNMVSFKCVGRPGRCDMRAMPTRKRTRRGRLRRCTRTSDASLGISALVRRSASEKAAGGEAGWGAGTFADAREEQRTDSGASLDGRRAAFHLQERGETRVRCCQGGAVS